MGDKSISDEYRVARGCLNLAMAGAVSFVLLPVAVIVLIIGFYAINGVQAGIDALQGPTLHERAISAAVEERDALLLGFPEPDHNFVEPAGPPPDCGWWRGCTTDRPGPIEGFDYDNQPLGFTTFEYQPETLAELDALRADLDSRLEAIGYSTICDQRDDGLNRDETRTRLARSQDTFSVTVNQRGVEFEPRLEVRLVSTAEEQRTLETPEHVALDRERTQVITCER